MIQPTLIVIFDGLCNLCESSVVFIIKRDKRAKFKVAQAQSEAGKKLQTQIDFDVAESNSMVLIKEGKAFFKSDAVLEVCRNLDGAWKLLSILKLLPLSFRNRAYEFVAKNRYRWFGKKDAYMVPTKELNARFIEKI